MKLDKMVIEDRKLSEIRPYWRNPRKNLKAIEIVKESVREYGYTVPIIIDKKGVIITGHTRYIALTQLDCESAQVVVSNMNARKAREFRIIDNKTAEAATWDIEKLMPELREIGGLSGFEGFFPELKLATIDKSGGDSAFNFSDDKSEDEVNKKIEATSQKMETNFENLTEKKQSDQLEVMCPECSESFFISMHDLKEGLKAKAIREEVENDEK